MFCLPHAGGSASVYAPWVRLAAPVSLEFVPVELPGRAGRLAEPMITDMARLVETLEYALLPETTEPFAIFGHSMGALVGYELVRRLVERGAPQPECLIVSGSGPPGSNEPLQAGELTDAALVDWIVRLGGTSQKFSPTPSCLASCCRRSGPISRCSRDTWPRGPQCFPCP